MNVAPLLSLHGFSNTYVVSEGSDALIVDPGSFDRQLLLYIEQRKLHVHAVLVTHRHPSHMDGLRTMRRIYHFEAYARDPGFGELSCREVRNGLRLRAGGLEVLCLETPGHSPDSVCYHVGDCLFTGDTLMAGEVGSTINGEQRRVLLDAIWANLMVWPEDTLVFPGHGPPSRVGVERRFNPHLACDPVS